METPQSLVNNGRLILHHIYRTAKLNEKETGQIIFRWSFPTLPGIEEGIYPLVINRWEMVTKFIAINGIPYRCGTLGCLVSCFLNPNMEFFWISKIQIFCRKSCKSAEQNWERIVSNFSGL
jgi:hypothetical protein